MSPSALDDSRALLRARAQKAEAAEPEPWRFPEMWEFRPNRYVLSFDATLTNCGWVVFAIILGEVTVIAKGTIRPKTDQKGYLETWDKADQLRSEIESLIARWQRTDPDILIVVEGPSVKGSRIESSLIAGMLVWCGRRGRCAVVSATHVSAVLLGDARVKSAPRKKMIREAVIRLFPAAATGWNEHERDGLATGMVHLYDTRKIS